MAILVLEALSFSVPLDQRAKPSRGTGPHEKFLLLASLPNITSDRRDGEQKEHAVEVQKWNVQALVSFFWVSV